MYSRFISAITASESDYLFYLNGPWAGFFNLFAIDHPQFVVRHMQSNYSFLVIGWAAYNVSPGRYRYLSSLTFRSSNYITFGGHKNI